MARPIKETPILFGEDARRFVERMNQVRRETPEERERRLANFELAMKMLDLGERTKKKSIMPQEMVLFVLYFVRFALSLSHEPKIKKRRNYGKTD